MLADDLLCLEEVQDRLGVPRVEGRSDDATQTKILINPMAVIQRLPGLGEGSQILVNLEQLRYTIVVFKNK